MWYVIQTISGKEHEVCTWIHTYVDASLYNRCFVPLYEDVWRKNGIGHISIKHMFSGYLFLETDIPDNFLGLAVGDRVINTTGIYGTMPLEVIEFHPGKNRVVVNVSIFGTITKVEMDIADVQLAERMEEKESL